MFELLEDLPLSTQTEIARIQAIPSTLRNATEAAFLVNLAPYLTNEVIEKDSDGLITKAAGYTVPESYTGFKKGATFIDKNASGNSLYNNTGDETSASWLLSQSISFGTPTNAGTSSGTLTSDNTNVADGATVVIGSITYTFKTALSAGPTVAYEVLIGSDADDSLLNLKKAINHEATEGTNYSTGTVAHPLVTCGAVAAHAVTVTSKDPGSENNAVGTTETSSHLSWGATTLSDVNSGTVGKKGEMYLDGSYLYIAIDNNTDNDSNWRRISLGSAF